ncbi:calcium/sodium antiporter [Alkalicoccus urumqiensis]|uniref:Sodium:proton exchanger n=1 Tax=Alkalicoccus urumqiensis TaxID=1548213 RepID=A0A2P6MLA7_ALKUR|nr:calcium/sodium antiporter [Alkalicoccus urumqiensis]PRO67053.1 sodium:proton exchanger [Alkalicoccus urumqiensis]
MSYLLLAVGFVLLIKGADYFVRGASSIAAGLRVSPLLIGLTVVAFGTSAPEATVSISAALEGNAGVAVGNAVGSNIFNIALILGVTALVSPLLVQSETVKKEIPFTFLAGAALLVMVGDRFLQQTEETVITRGDGLLLLLFFSVFLYYVIETARKGRAEQGVPDAGPPPEGPLWKQSLLTIGGLAAVVIGGDIVVRNAVVIALDLGMSETLVGLTIVAAGTSLPELITSLTAALKKEADIAVGNIVGSNIFNIFFVLGAAGTIAPLVTSPQIAVDIIFMLVITALLLVFASTGLRIGRREGAVLALAYLLYMIYIIIRN